MGKLVTETPFSEVSATLEVLDRFGIEREDLTMFRKASSYTQMEVVRLMKNGERSVSGPKIIAIDRSKPFDPAELLGPGWTIWRGPADGNGLAGAEEQDKRSLALTEVDLTKVLLETVLLPGQTSITGEERLKRLKVAGHIRLDAQVFRTFWNNKLLIPERLKEKTGNNTTFIFFDGTILRSPDGDRCALFLCWGGSQWDWYYHWLDDDRDADDPSAVLAS